MAKSHGIIYSSSPQHPGLYGTNPGVELRKQIKGPLSMLKMNISNKRLWHIFGKLSSFVTLRRSSLCRSTEMHNLETKECVRHFGDCSGISRGEDEDECRVMQERIIHSNQGLAEAIKFVYNDAKYVNERARNDIVLLSCGLMRLDACVRQDIGILGLEFLKLDARAREDTEKIDNDVKRRAEHLHHIAIILKDKAQSRLKRAADKHWSDGALEADLRRADFIAKQRATEDALMALELIKNIHDMMEAYWSIASVLSEADGIDYSDPEELELLVAALIDLDAMDGKSSVSLLAECSSSPDVNTRKALASALSAAPSMWTLGNAGMGALQRLAEDSNPAIAAAASRTILELKKQSETAEGDSWRYMMNQKTTVELDNQEADDDKAKD